LTDFADRHLKRPSPLSDLLSPLGRINSLLQTQRRKRLSNNAWRPHCKVISIGNIVCGGSGKTPFTIYLAALMQASGYRVGVSHRGYKGGLEKSAPTLISGRDGLLHEVEAAGDEALLIASRLPGIPVVVGKHRVAAVSLLLAKYPDLDAVLLDDAFQHLSIARDLDVVCFEADTGCSNGRVLPAGYLREPLTALNFASLIVVNHKHPYRETEGGSDFWAEFRNPLLHCRLQPRDVVSADGKEMEISSLRRKKLLLISGIANPDSFEATLKAAGLSWLHHFRFADHYAFTNKAEIRRMACLARKYGAETLLCTEKDLAKLARHGEIRDMLLALRMDLVCEDEEALMGLVKLKVPLS